jgi:hypothetical protein
MLNRFNSFLGAMVPSDNLGGLLSPQDARAAGQQARAMLASGLLQAAGPQRMPVSLGQALGGAMPAAFEAYDRRAELGLRNDLTRRHIEELDRADRERVRREQDAQLMSELMASLGTEADGAGPLVTPRVSKFLAAGARIDPRGAMSIAAQIPGLFGAKRELSDAGAKIRDVSTALGRDLTEREVFALSGASELFDPTDDELDKPLTPTDLRSVRRPDGSQFEFGTTFREAQSAGAAVFSPDDLKRRQNVESALGMLTNLRELQGQIDDSGVIKGVGSNMLARLANGIGNAVSAVAGTEAAEARTVFRDLSRGTIAPLIRTLGDSGALSDGDVNRALALLPDNGGLLPDSTTLANEKLDELEKIFRRAAESLGMTDAGSPSTGGGIRFLGFEE